MGDQLLHACVKCTYSLVLQLSKDGGSGWAFIVAQNKARMSDPQRCCCNQAVNTH
jgi:hypothetical protein